MERRLAMNLARNIRHRREELNISQSTLARISDCSIKEIEILESEDDMPDILTLAKVRDPLEISTDHALFDPDPYYAESCILYRYDCAARQRIEKTEYYAIRKFMFALYRLLYSPNPMVRHETHDVLGPIVGHLTSIFGKPRRGFGEIVSLDERKNGNL